MADFEMRTPQDRAPGGHISEGELAALLDGALDPAERSRVEAHLEVCTECRCELIEMRRITNGYAKRGTVASGLRRRWWIPVAVAAGLGAVFLPRVFAPSAPREPVRAGARVEDGEGRARIDIVAPAENAAIPRTGLTFTWRGAAADVYHVSLLAEDGEPIWSAETADTSLALPPTVPVRSGHSYFWRVEAIANGIAASTGVHRVQIAP